MQRLVGLLVVLILLLAGVLLFQQFMTSKSQKSLPAATSKKQPKGADDARMTALKFYQTYDTCLKQPPKEAEGQLSLYCQQQNAYSSISLSENILENGTDELANDPVLCGQLTPSGYQVSDVKEQDGSLIVSVGESFGSSIQHLRVNVTQEDGKMKVSDIICPQS